MPQKPAEMDPKQAESIITLLTNSVLRHKFSFLLFGGLQEAVKAAVSEAYEAGLLAGAVETQNESVDSHSAPDSRKQVQD